MEIERVNYPQLGQPAGPYVHATRYNGFLFLSGLTAFGTPAQQGSIGEQAQAVFAQIKQILEAEGVTVQNLLKVTIFVTELEELDGLRAAAATFYGGVFPASSLVQVKRLFAPDVKIEIEAVVAVPESR